MQLFFLIKSKIVVKEEEMKLKEFELNLHLFSLIVNIIYEFVIVLVKFYKNVHVFSGFISLIKDPFLKGVFSFFKCVSLWYS